MLRLPSVSLFACVAVLALGAVARAEDLPARSRFDLESQPMARALNAFAQQAGLNIYFDPPAVEGLRAPSLKAEMTATDALARLLAGTRLQAIYVDRNTVRVVPATTRETPLKSSAAAADGEDPTNIMRLAQGQTPVMQKPENPGSREKEPSASSEDSGSIPEILVKGKKSINADIPRTREDVQPYVVFSREQIEQSNAANLDEFFRTRLPMNNPGAGSLTAPQTGYINSSAINLRGLGTNQTLILVDGRRLPDRATSPGGVASSQGDINGIPISMVERIEILPSTASGIYGGGATGGVVNIITRKDYSGVEAALSYANTFDTDASTRRMDLGGSFSLQGGKTFVTLGASHSDGTSLLVRDRDIIPRSRALQLSYNPAAFYGPTVTPPVGYTTNIRNSAAANLVLKPQYGGATLNSPYTHVPVGYAGAGSDNGAGLVAAAGAYNLDLPGTLVAGGLSSMLSTPLVKSVALGARHRFGSNVEAYVDGSSLKNIGRGSVLFVTPTSTTLAANASNNPFTTAVVVAYPVTNLSDSNSQENDSARLATGVVVRLARHWTLGADYSRTRSRQILTQFSNIVGDPDGTGPLISYATALSSGAADVMKDLNVYPLNYTPYLMPKPTRIFDNTMVGRLGTLRASGPAWELPAGPINLAMSVDWRRDEQPSVITEVAAAVPATFTWFPRVGTDQGSAYVEARVPVFSEQSNTLLRALDIQASVRYDTYRYKGMSSTNGVAVAGPDGPAPTTAFSYLTRSLDATSSMAGFKYSPTKDIALRASWGTGFLPPALGQRTSSLLSFSTTLIDPKRGDVAASTGVITLNQGGNPDLNPEYSTNLSAGVIFTPRLLPGLRLSVDYTQIHKRDEISSLNLQQVLALEDVIPGLVIRDPLTPADQALGYTGGRITTMAGFRAYNIAKREVAAIDFQMDYERQVGSFGWLHPYVMATYQPEFSTRLVPSAPLVNEAGYYSSLRWRGNAGVDWKRGRWSAAWNMQYYDSYYRYGATFTAAQIAAIILNQGTAKVPSQVYHDLSVDYDFGDQSEGWLRYLNGTRLTVGVQNVLNTMPPIGAGTGASQGFPGGFAQGISPYGDPRLARYTLTLRKKL